MRMGLISYNSYDFELLFPNISLSLSDYQSSAPFTRHRIYLPLLYGILFVTGIAGNAWVIYVIASVRWLGNQRPHMGSNQTLGSNAQLHAPSNCCHRVGNRRQSRASLQQQYQQLQRGSHSGSRISQTAHNVQVYIMCLCCFDLIVLVFLLFLISDLIMGQWPVRSTFLCRAYMASESVNKFCVPFLLVALSGYCYSTVSQCEPPVPVSTGSTGVRRGSKTLSACSRINFRSPLISAFVCVCAGFALVTPVYLHSDIKYFVSYNDTSHDIRWVMSKCGFSPPDNLFMIFTSYSFVCGYTLPSILFTCFYISILRVVYERAKRSSNEPDGRRAPRTHRLSSVAKTTLGLVLFYQLCWSPYWIMTMWQYIQGGSNGEVKYSAIGVELAYFVHVLPYINCTGYPIVYTLMNKNIKETYNRIREMRRAQRESAQYDLDESCPCQRAQSGRPGVLGDLRYIPSRWSSSDSARSSIDYRRRRASRPDSLSDTRPDTEIKTVTPSDAAVGISDIF